MIDMSFLQRLMLVSWLTSISYAGVIEKRQAVETFLTCTIAPNPSFCPDPYCVCTQPLTETISGIVTTDDMVNVYAATSGPVPCPTAGAAVSEAGCQIVVVSKTDSTCGPVIFNTAFCLPSSTASMSSGSTPAQVASASQTSVQQIMSTTVLLSSGSTPTQPAPAPSITTGPIYTITENSHCISNGVTLSPTITPLQTCGPLTAPYNCAPYGVLPWSALDPMSAISGCACGEDSWDMPPWNTVQIFQGAQTNCNPSYSSKGPWAEISSVANTPTYWDLYPNCKKWLGDNTADPTPGNNPCSGFWYIGTTTASCEYVTQVDGLGQADDMCTCSHESPKYTTDWFGDCPSSSYVQFTGNITIS